MSQKSYHQFIIADITILFVSSFSLISVSASSLDFYQSENFRDEYPPLSCIVSLAEGIDLGMVKI